MARDNGSFEATLHLVKLDAVGEQGVGGGELAGAESEVEGAGTFAVWKVGGRAGGEQKPDDFSVTFLGGDVEGGGVGGGVLALGAGAVLEQEGDDGGLALPGRLFERGDAAFIDDVDFGAASDQEFDKVVVAAVGGQVKDGGAGAVAGGDVGATVEQESDNGAAVGDDGVVERR